VCGGYAFCGLEVEGKVECELRNVSFCTSRDSGVHRTDILAIPRKNNTSAPMYIDRIFNTRSGRVAYSPRRHCKVMNAMPHTPKVTNRPMIVGLDQGRVWPPHWRARRRETIEPRKITVPKGSRCFNFSAMGRDRFFLLVSGETCTNMMIATRMAKPIGTLLKLSV
jgi:hypothetical protein